MGVLDNCLRLLGVYLGRMSRVIWPTLGVPPLLWRWVLDFASLGEVVMSGAVWWVMRVSAGGEGLGVCGVGFIWGGVR